MSDLISKLSDLRSRYNCFDDNERDAYGTLSEAIKVLSQLEERALHESCTDCPLYDHDRHSCPRFNRVIPTAILDAQPKKGKWIAVHDPVFADTYYCSECKEEPLATDTGWVLSKFCPNCGAFMSEGETDD